MKIVVASDLHGSMFWTTKLVEKIEKINPDMIVLLGDLYYHGPRNPLTEEYDPMHVCEQLNKLKNKLLVLKGNCDAEVDEMISEFPFEQSLSMQVGEKVVFFSHGHKFNKDSLPSGKFDVMFYGHFHTHFIKNENGKVFVNPGSISLPKDGTANSYAVLTDEEVAIFDFDDNVVESLKFELI